MSHIEPPVNPHPEQPAASTGAPLAAPGPSATGAPGPAPAVAGAPGPVPVPVPVPVPSTSLADGEWHRLHPATPFLKGGVALIAITGIVIANLRERVLEFFFGVPTFGDDPLDELYNRGAVGWALLAVTVVLIGIIAGFYLSWRLHSFRVTPEVVEVRSGILFRSNRKARLDRIQGVNIDRPFLARIFGAAKLEVGVAGQDANVQLAFLGSANADSLRRDILWLASGARQSAAPTGAPVVAGPVGTGVPPAAPVAAPLLDTAGNPVGGTAVPAPVLSPAASAGHGLASSVGAIVTQRANEFLAPELDPDAAPPESVVHIPTGRLIGSIVASGFTLVLIVLAFVVPIALANEQYWVFFAFVPALIGGASYYINRFTKGLRYTIAGTDHGVRVGFGLLSTSNETIPPGRIHAIAVSQPLLWRPFGWWTIRINTAGHSQQNGQNASNTVVLPVGLIGDVERVLALLLPEAGLGAPAAATPAAVVAPAPTAMDALEAASVEPALPSLIERGLTSKGGADGFRNAPKRGAWLRPFSWRRTGFALTSSAVLMRTGVITRDLAIVPFARLQSVGLTQGPIQRKLSLGGVRLHTVAGPVSAHLSVIDTVVAAQLFESLSAGAVSSDAADTSHHWGQRAATQPAVQPAQTVQPLAQPTAAQPTAAQPTAAQQASAPEVGA